MLKRFAVSRTSRSHFAGVMLLLLACLPATRAVACADPPKAVFREIVATAPTVFVFQLTSAFEVEKSLGGAARTHHAVGHIRVLDALKADAALAQSDNDQKLAHHVAERLEAIYADRPDMARAREVVKTNLPHLFDGTEIITLAERSLMAPLDARAKVLTAASARRVALVTAVSPRALVDVAFVIYESVRLAGAIAALYGARPGFFGFWRLTGAVLAHLAVTGGLVLTDGIVEQLIGQGLAAKLSARLGEGVVNGLMTVRVGIAAMRVVRPLPFDTQPQPTVRDFIPELTKVMGDTQKT